MHSVPPRLGPRLTAARARCRANMAGLSSSDVPYFAKCIHTVVSETQ